MELRKIELKNLPKEGRVIKGKTYHNGDIVEMVDAQADAYIRDGVGEEVKSKPTKSQDKRKKTKKEA